MCRRVGTENETVLFRFLLQFVQHQTRLNAREFVFRIDREDAIHVFREIDDDCDIAALTGQTRPPAAACDRCAKFSAKIDSDDDISAVARNDNADRNLAIVGAVGGIKRARAVIETHFAADRARKFGGELRDASVHAFNLFWWRRRRD